MPFHQALTGELLAAVEEHGIESLAYTGAGQGVGWFNELKTVQEIVHEEWPQQTQLGSWSVQFGNEHRIIEVTP